MIFYGDVRLFFKGNPVAESKTRYCPWNIWNHPAEFTDEEVITEILNRCAEIEIIARGGLDVALERTHRDGEWANQMYLVRLTAISGTIIGTRESGPANAYMLDNANSDTRFVRYLINSGRCALEVWLTAAPNHPPATTAAEQLSLFQP